jgi:predicted dehydrogenase
MPATDSRSSRREFFQQSAAATAAAGLASGLFAPSAVYAAGSDTLKVGLVGCGGRGKGAVEDALAADPYAQLTAVADAFVDRAQDTLKQLGENPEVAERIAVDQEHVFAGFDAYRQLVDSGVDVVLLATPPHFRPMHLDYAVSAGKHTFVEKPIAVDLPGVRSVQETCQRAKDSGLSVVSGLCWRYDRGVNATMDKIQEGAIGDIIAIQSSYNAGTLWHRGNDPAWSRMEYQIRNWLYYTWLSGDHICEQAVHSLDKCGWLLGDELPVSAVGMGGRQQRTDPKYGHIFDHHTVVYDFADGKKVFFSCRQQDNTAMEVEEHVLGTDGTAHVLSHEIDDRNGKRKWRYRGPKPSMYRVEHEALFSSIRNGKPINNGPYMCNSTLLAIMGRMATYTGKRITREELTNNQESLGPATYEWGDMPEPAVAIPGVASVA